jgi:hypothetical protein
MKSIQSALFGMLMFMVCTCGVANAQIKEKPKKLIIAVNTLHGIGYFVDSTGTFLFNKQFWGVSSFSEGLAPIIQNGKWGFINTKGEMVIPCIYDGAGNFSEGLASVEQNGKCGSINTKGEVVLPCIYDRVRDFSEGLAFVEQNGIWSVINTEGKVIVAECTGDTSWSRVEME